MTLLGGHTHTRFAASMASASPVTRLDMQRVFVQTQNWGTGPWLEATGAIVAGRTPVISTKLTGTWSGIPQGSNDARLDGAVTGLIAQPRTALLLPVFLTFHHEPEGDDTPSNYNIMWKYLYNRYNTKLKNAGIELCFIMMGGTFSGWTNWTLAQMEQAIAGVPIKYLFADVYEKPGGTAPWASPTKPYVDPTSASSPFQKYFDYCKAKGLIAALPEIGVNRRQTDGGEQSTWLDKLAVAPFMVDCLFANYYDSDVGEGGSTSNTRISHLPNAMKSFAKSYKAAGPGPDPDPDPDPDCEALELEITALEQQLAATKTQRDDAVQHNSVLQGKIDAAKAALQ